MKIGDYEQIISTIGHYLEGARLGKGDVMRPAFHSDATIFGYVGPDFWAGPIQSLYDWNDKNGPAPEIVSKVVAIDIVETIAVAKVESDNWTGYRFTDFFTLIKVDGEWKIMNKVFHLHA
ncbi:nuclear transport factor 2 family protein [Rhizobium mesosinicum]|nr:nuclear transport factor 2 family protein [Rhizobium mesosinicum]